MDLRIGLHCARSPARQKQLPRCSLWLRVSAKRKKINFQMNGQTEPTNNNDIEKDQYKRCPNHIFWIVQKCTYRWRSQRIVTWFATPTSQNIAAFGSYNTSPQFVNTTHFDFISVLLDPSVDMANAFIAQTADFVGLSPSLTEKRV